MNKKLFLYLIFITLLTSGCLTTSSLVRTLEQNSNMTPYEADQKFGKPAEEYPTPDRTIICKIYTPAFTDYKDRTVVLFANNKLFRYGRFSKFFVLDVMKDLGALPEDKYRWEYEKAAREEESRRNMEYQMLRDWQNTQFQNQILSNQRKLIELEKQKANSAQYNQPQIIGRQSTTDCYTDSQGNIHCTTNQH